MAGRPFLKLKNMKISQKAISFLKEVRLETKKVNWPARNETIKYTLIVIGASLIVALFLGGIDFGLSFLLNKIIALK
jgi:preprotein translocase subunit SecE